MEQWLNTSVYGLALAAVAWAAARPPLFDAAWRGRIWAAALVGLAVLTASPLLTAAVSPPGAVSSASVGGNAAAVVPVPALDVSPVLLLFAWGAVALSRVAVLALAVLAAIGALVVSAPALPRVFDVAETLTADAAVVSDGIASGTDPRVSVALPRGVGSPRRHVLAAVPLSAPRGAGDGQAASSGPRREGTEATAGAFELRPSADGMLDVSGDRTATTDARGVSIASRAWSEHVPPPGVRGQGGTGGDNVEGRAGASAPFPTIGSTFSRAGVGTGRWFSRAGASVASAVASK